MATIRRIVSSGAISDFRQSAPAAGGGFRLLAAGFDALYDQVLPKAIAEETAKGAALGRDLARQQIGGGAVYGSTMGAPGDPKYREAIASIESGGRYDAVGPTNANLGRALGKYQMMEANIGPWSQEALGRTVTAAEFLANPAIQDTIFDHKFGGYVAQFGEEGAAQAWFAGPGGVGKTDRKDVLGTDVGSYGQRFMSALGGTVTMSSSGTPEAAAAFTPTMMRDADGQLVSRLYDPSSDPIKQAFNMAASADYQSQVFLNSTVDLMGMREQFALDPQGFYEAAESYLETVVEKAPTLFQQEIRAGLAKDVQQVFLGILDDQHRDTQQRAANSNGALIDKWSDDLGAAIAGGDPKEIAGAQDKLSSALAVRERLPGLAWTPEQSAERVRKAQEDGQRRIQKAQDDQVSGWRKMLGAVTKAAKAGLSAANEDILDNPTVQAMLPDEVREAMAFTTLRDQMPSFMRMPPQEQTKALADLKPTVQEEWEVDLWGAAEKSAAENAKALAEDPIKRLGEIFPEDPPPPMPDLSNPDALPAWLSARAVYAQRKTTEGFMPKPVYLSKEEAVAVGALFGKEVPPEMKAAAAGTIVSAMGESAAGFFRQIKANDPVIPHVGAMMAKGGDVSVATEAMTGQSLLDQKVVPAPSATSVAKGYSADIQAALGANAATLPALDGVRKTAIALYAARVPANADEDMQAKIMEEAWQSALGQTTAVDGETLLGGVQTVGGNPVMMPLGMAGTELESALGAAFGSDGSSGIWNYGPTVGVAPQPDLDLWAATGGIPVLGGQPLDSGLWDDGEISLTPMGGSKYMLSVIRNGAKIDVGVQGQDPSMPFIFDAEKLIAAARVPK